MNLPRLSRRLSFLSHLLEKLLLFTKSAVYKSFGFQILEPGTVKKQLFIQINHQPKTVREKENYKSAISF